MPAWCTPSPLANSCCTSFALDLSTYNNMIISNILQ